MERQLVKAIETRYKGYRFRSRLEARWAVFFDALALRWEYEPEGFELPGGLRYLPDFRLTDPALGEVWVEVKPSPSSEEDWREANALALSGKAVLLLAGAPRFQGHTLHLVDNAGWMFAWFDTGRLVKHERPSAASLAACTRATSARFEFGERG